jgi:hypothetical protein
MGFFKKQSDPVTERSRKLKAEIDALEAEIQKLSSKIESHPSPRWRSTALPKTAPPPETESGPREPVFEEIAQPRLKVPEPIAPVDEHQALPDRPGWGRRLMNFLRGRPASNPKLVNYLAAGSIQGLRPLRYEKRISRNRFIVLAVVLLLVVWGIIAFFMRSP